MNSKEKRAIRRKFCKKTQYNHIFETEAEGLAYLEKSIMSWADEKPRGTIIPCSICGCYHFLREYKENDYMIYRFPNLEEREILMEPVPLKADYSRKRTKKKMIGRYRNVRRFPKPKHRFGTVPDDGSFYRIVSERYVCFTCRKSWRNFDRRADRRKAQMKNWEKHMATCPHCGSSLQQVYPMFRAPKRNDVKEWEKLEKRLTRKKR